MQAVKSTTKNQSNMVSYYAAQSQMNRINEQKNYISWQWTTWGTTCAISILVSFEEKKSIRFVELTGSQTWIIEKGGLHLGG
jgi:hypothetical protein